MMSGTVLPAGAPRHVFWMNYRQAQRLAVVQDDSDGLQAARAQDDRPDRQRAEARQAADGRAGRAEAQHRSPRRRSPPSPTTCCGRARRNRAASSSKALRANGYTGSSGPPHSPRAPPSRARPVPPAPRPVRHRDRLPANIPTAEKFKSAFQARFKRAPGFDAMQAYDAVRKIAHAIAARPRRPPTSRRSSSRSRRSTRNFTNSMGVVRFAADHTLLYDNRVILEGKDGKLTWKRSLRTDSL